NFHLNEQLAAWNGRMGALADHHEVHDWYHWTIASNSAVGHNLPTLADSQLPVPTWHDHQLLYDSLDVDLNADGQEDGFGGGAYLGYYFTVVGGGIGNVVHSGARIFTLDVARAEMPLYLGAIADTVILEPVQGVAY